MKNVKQIRICNARRNENAYKHNGIHSYTRTQTPSGVQCTMDVFGMNSASTLDQSVCSYSLADCLANGSNQQKLSAELHFVSVCNKDRSFI